VDHPDTLTNMANLASTSWNRGWWDAAEELEVQVMKKLGTDHPDTLTSMANLAFTRKEQGCEFCDMTYPISKTSHLLTYRFYLVGP
jgi:hypothetical protein